jgi:hypothetical protein
MLTTWEPVSPALSVAVIRTCMERDLGARSLIKNEVWPGANRIHMSLSPWYSQTMDELEMALPLES